MRSGHLLSLFTLSVKIKKERGERGLLSDQSEDVKMSTFARRGKSTKTQDWLTPGQASAFLEEFEFYVETRGRGRHGRRCALMAAKLQLFCGLRIGEVINLRVGGIRSGNLNIEPDLITGWQPKNSSVGTVPIPAGLRREIKIWIDEFDLSNQDYLIFRLNNKNQYTRRHITRIYKDVAKRVFKDFRLHSHMLRKTCASLYLNEGGDKVSMADVQSLLRHKNILTTTRYLRPVDSARKLTSLIDIIETSLKR